MSLDCISLPCGKQTDDEISLMRVASAALDEAAGWLAYRVGTYDEQPGERDAERRAREASHALKLRLATHVLDCATDEPRKALQRR